MKEVSRGSAAAALLPSKETLGGAYFELRDRIDQIATQAEQQGSLKVALSGLNSIRHALDSLARLAGHDGTQVNVAVQTNVNVDVGQIVERLIKHFDTEPDLKARIAQALMEMDHEQSP
jgi:multidrug efflux pump subunit AcrA (membrane-fusion protein)